MDLYTMDSLITENNHRKVRTYKTLVRHALKYGSKPQTLMQMDKLKLHTFERTFLCEIYGPVQEKEKKL
jgi:hypothetical protein